MIFKSLLDVQVHNEFTSFAGMQDKNVAQIKYLKAKVHCMFHSEIVQGKMDYFPASVPRGSLITILVCLYIIVMCGELERLEYLNFAHFNCVIYVAWCNVDFVVCYFLQSQFFICSLIECQSVLHIQHISSPTLEVFQWLIITIFTLFTNTLCSHAHKTIPLTLHNLSMI